MRYRPVMQTALVAEIQDLLMTDNQLYTLVEDGATLVHHQIWWRVPRYAV